MAAGDLAVFQTAAVEHARAFKRALHEAKMLLDLWDKLALPGSETAAAPLSNTDLTNYATLCAVLQDLADNVAVTAADRRGVIERVGTIAVVR